MTEHNGDGSYSDRAANEDTVDQQPKSEGSLALQMAPAEPKKEPKKGRRKRRRRQRARTISIRRLSKAELARGRDLFPEESHWRPKTRSECKDLDRPCPFVSCKYHLYIDVHPVRGSIKLNFPDIEVWEMSESCALDVADRSGITLEEVGEIMNLTRERVRQVETQALTKLNVVDDMGVMFDCLDD